MIRPRSILACLATAAAILILPAAASGQAESTETSEVLITQAESGTVSDPGALEVLSGPDFAASLPSDPVRAAVLAGLDGLQADGNTAVIDQRGDRNSATTRQFGFRNVAAVLQTGSENVIDVLQDGDANLFGAWLDGSNNVLGIEQRGEDNQYFLQFVGQDLSHTVLQNGTGLRAVQLGTGTAPFSIRQEGLGVEVRIEHNGPVR